MPSRRASNPGAELASHLATVVDKVARGANDAAAVATATSQTLHDQVRGLLAELRLEREAAAVANLRVVELHSRLATVERELAQERARDKTAEVKLKQVEVLDKHLDRVGGALLNLALNWKTSDARVQSALHGLLAEMPEDVLLQMRDAAPDKYRALSTALKGVEALVAPPPSPEKAKPS